MGLERETEMARYIILFYGNNRTTKPGKVVFAGILEEVAITIRWERDHWTNYKVYDLENARMTESGDF